MCGPALTLAVAVFSAYSAIKQGQNAQAQSEYAAKVSEANAKVAAAQAVDAENRGANDAAVARENWQKANATARAQAGGAGLLADTGTMGQIQDQNVEQGELNVLTVRNNAAREAWGYRVQSANALNQAAADRFSGKVSAQNGLLTGVGSFLQGASTAASKSAWLQNSFGGGK